MDGVLDVQPVPAYCDNKGAIAVHAAGHHSSRIRHIALAFNSVFHLARAGPLQPSGRRQTKCWLTS